MNPVLVKNETSYWEFEKLEGRVGTITNFSEVQKTKKLAKLTVDFGGNSRSILPGI